MLFTCFNLQAEIIHLFRDYYLLLSEAKYKAKYGRGLKILILKRMLQRLLTALTQ